MAPRTIPAAASQDQALGQLQGTVVAILDQLEKLSAQASAAAAVAAQERHEMLGIIQEQREENAGLKRDIKALNEKVSEMSPAFRRLNRYGLILMGVLMGASAVGGAFGAKVWPFILRIIGIAA